MRPTWAENQLFDHHPKSLALTHDPVCPLQYHKRLNEVNTPILQLFPTAIVCFRLFESSP